MPRLFRGEIIGSLELVKPVKFSGDCEVWLAADSNGYFAILKSAPANSCEAEKILLSAKIIKNIKSPGLAEILSFGISEAGIAYVATKYAARGTLAKFIKNKRRLTQAQTVKMLRGTLAGLAALHDLGIVHRDVKPDNIFILQDGSAVLGDFGAAKFPNIGEPSGAVFGSAPYMSPEQAKDSTDVSPACDLFSLGCVAYECLTGKRRYAQKNFTQTLKAILSDRSSAERELQKASGPPIPAIVSQMMQHCPSARPASAREVFDKIAMFREEPIE